MNSLDVQLYEFGVKLFEQRVGDMRRFYAAEAATDGKMAQKPASSEAGTRSGSKHNQKQSENSPRHAQGPFSCDSSVVCWDKSAKGSPWPLGAKPTS